MQVSQRRAACEFLSRVEHLNYDEWKLVDQLVNKAFKSPYIEVNKANDDESIDDLTDLLNIHSMVITASFMKKETFKRVEKIINKYLHKIVHKDQLLYQCDLIGAYNSDAHD